MKWLLVFMLLLGAAVPGFAGAGFPAQVDPGFKTDSKRMPAAELPKGLQQRLVDDPDEVFKDENGRLVKTLEVLAVDLNSDHEYEYLVWAPSSYTGGPVIHLFGSASAGFPPIGVVQGDYYFAKPVNGYLQIVYTARAGPETYERRLTTFTGKGYEDSRAAEYRINDAGDLVFVKDLPATRN